MKPPRGAPGLIEMNMSHMVSSEPSTGISDDDNHDDRDYYNSDPEPDEVQVFLSDNSGVQHFEDWIPTKVPNHISSQPKVQPEATFGPQETTRLADGDVANDITPDPDLIIHGTNFDVLLAQHPVNARMLFSMATILLLESIVHCYSYTRCMHLHTGGGKIIHLPPPVMSKLRFAPDVLQQTHQCS
jgi:hypothetical protein